MEFYTYFRNTWIKSMFSAWQIYENPVGYANTNSPIESFNKEIKATFTKRRKLSVLGFVKKMVEIVQYYSNAALPFETEFKWQNAAKRTAKQIDLSEYVKIDKNRFSYSGYRINILKKTCTCCYFIKWGICKHLIAYITKEELHNKRVEFAYKAKRGKKRGRPEKNKKDLEFD